MKKIYIFMAIVLILFGIGLGFYFYKSKTNNSNSNNSKLNDFPYNSTRVLANDNSQSSDNQPSGSPQDQNSNNNTSNNTESTNNTSSGDSPSQPAEEPTKPQNTETQIANFTTKIYTKDSDRQNNISITCSTLNDTTIENGETFSFCNTVGKATSSKGYKKADVYKDGEKIEALGRWKLPSKFYFI